MRTTDQDIRVAVLVFDGVKLLDVAGPSEVFGEADRYTLVLCSPDGRGVRTSTGVRLAVDARADEVGEVDTLLVPGSDDFPAVPASPAILAAVLGLAARARRVASVCTGAFVLAEAGLLDGRRATTHWAHTATLRERYPEVRVDPDVLYIDDGDVL
ncbi:MAG: AraC family transcriptional regulator, partial [Umezawaea sp.]